MQIFPQKDTYEDTVRSDVWKNICTVCIRVKISIMLSKYQWTVSKPADDITCHSVNRGVTLVQLVGQSSKVVHFPVPHDFWPTVEVSLDKTLNP